MLMQKRIEIFELEEVLLLDYLGIDVRRPKSLDLGDEEVSNALYSLRCYILVDSAAGYRQRTAPLR